MKPQSSDLNLFRVLDTIYTAGNLTKAGQELGVTQPAVSNALARLRKIYDDPLFIRSGSHMRPTFKTEQMMPHVRIALELLSSTIEPHNAPEQTSEIA